MGLSILPPQISQGISEWLSLSPCRGGLGNVQHGNIGFKIKQAFTSGPKQDSIECRAIQNAKQTLRLSLYAMKLQKE
jgi:hypothetical protein